MKKLDTSHRDCRSPHPRDLSVSGNPINEMALNVMGTVLSRSPRDFEQSFLPYRTRAMI